ncbi:MAG: exodeoxyribonuclease III [Vulcanimicrobiota bacterium]
MQFPLKIATWNLNGLRARATQLLEWIDSQHPDVLCLQEIRVTHEQIPMDLFALPGYHCYWHGGGKGYSGVALLVNQRLGQPEFSHPEFDFESRIVTARVGELSVTSVYVPNGGKDFGAKTRFMDNLKLFLSQQSAPQVILAGDLNVARDIIDVHPKERKAKPVIGQLPEERDWFNQVLAQGFCDVQRQLHPEDDRIFSWWAPWRELRAKNIGWRIDYILASDNLGARAKECVSQREFGTSDHAPVVAVFE